MGSIDALVLTTQASPVSSVAEALEFARRELDSHFDALEHRVSCAAKENELF